MINNVSKAEQSFALSDDLWRQIQLLLPAEKAKKRAGRPRMDDRKAMTAILYILYTGCRWKSLPDYMGAPSTIHDRFQEWRRAGVFERMAEKGLLKPFSARD